MNAEAREPDPLVNVFAEMWAVDLDWDPEYEGEQANGYAERFYGLLDVLAKTPAVSLDGVAAKLRHLVIWHSVGTSGHEEELLRTALEAVERMAAEAGS